MKNSQAKPLNDYQVERLLLEANNLIIWAELDYEFGSSYNSLPMKPSEVKLTKEEWKWVDKIVSEL